MKIDSEKLKISLKNIQVKVESEISRAYNRGVKASISIIETYEKPV